MPASDYNGHLGAQTAHLSPVSPTEYIYNDLGFQLSHFSPSLSTHRALPPSPSASTPPSPRAYRPSLSLSLRRGRWLLPSRGRRLPRALVWQGQIRRRRCRIRRVRGGTRSDPVGCGGGGRGEQGHGGQR